MTQRDASYGVKQSFAWWAFASERVAPETLVRGAADIGYKAIEMPPREHWALIRDHGLVVLNTQGHPLVAEGLNRPEHLPMIKAALKTTLDLAREWGLEQLICFSGERQGLDDAVGVKNAITNLKELVPLAEDSGVTLILEVLNSKVDHPDYQADHTSWAVEVCAAVDSPNLKILYDIYHMQVMEGDIIRTIQSHHQHFGHYHTAGNPGRQDIDATQEIAYPAIFRAIQATGYSGYIGHELKPKRDPLTALKTIYDLTAHSLAGKDV